MKIEVGFGDRNKYAEIPDEKILDILLPNDIVQGPTGRAAVQMALAEPVGTPRLRDIVAPDEKIAIITSDITRPMPSSEVLPLVLDELYEAGVSSKDITVVFARGIHRAHTGAEQRKLIGDALYGEIECIDSDPEDCIRLGYTKSGTPVDIFSIVAEADRRICLGNIEYHYFAGYSGGAKAMFPGTSSEEAIQANHSAMIMPGAEIGRIDGNPIREDLEEAAQMCKIDFILNVVLDERKKIVYAVAGDAVGAHRKGCEFLDKLYRVYIPGKADIVIASQGGTPKDINLYQTEKALENAKYAVKDGGTVILVGECGEGMGNDNFEKWMLEAHSPGDLINRIHSEFKLGGHKAAAMAMVMEHADIYLVSDMDPELVKKMFLKPFKYLQDAVDEAMKKYGSGAGIIVMPFGGSTLPAED